MRNAGNRFYFLSSLFFVGGAILNLAGYRVGSVGTDVINLIGCLLFFGGATANLLDKPRQ
jgi:hypothetical protein